MTEKKSYSPVLDKLIWGDVVTINPYFKGTLSITPGQSKHSFFLTRDEFKSLINELQEIYDAQEALFINGEWQS